MMIMRIKVRLLFQSVLICLLYFHTILYFPYIRPFPTNNLPSIPHSQKYQLLHDQHLSIATDTLPDIDTILLHFGHFFIIFGISKDITALISRAAFCVG